MHRCIRTIRQGSADGHIDHPSPHLAHGRDQFSVVGNDKILDPLKSPLGNAVAFGLHLAGQWAVRVPCGILHIDDHKRGPCRIDHALGIELFHIIFG